MNIEACADPYPDPYDLWATSAGVWARRNFYRGSSVGLVASSAVGVVDWLVPILARRLCGVRYRAHPVTIALRILQRVSESPLSHAEARLATQMLESAAAVSGDDGVWAWGLGFAWMSKNGLYKPDIPFVTHTPYVMEALRALPESDCSRRLFDGTWGFLQSLKVMAQSADTLALSYAPLSEPRIVVNANAYACLAYAMHARDGHIAIRGQAQSRADALARWVVTQQQDSGAWWYYADQDAGNFIDGFHSCFVIKNLRKAAALLPTLQPIVAAACDRGAHYVHQNFVDADSGLCRRFLSRSIKDPFRWDLYDQAEYLGLLIDEGALDRARNFAARVRDQFFDGQRWYCRIDMFGRRWGGDFMRWGIVPMQYQLARLEHTQARILAAEPRSCAA